MEDFEKRLLLAQQNNKELNRLLSDYIPFIKKQISNKGVFKSDYDDMLSLAMLAFINCVKQYSENKGSFLSFASISIKHRLIDEFRKQQKYSSKLITLYSDEKNDKVVQSAEEHVSLYEYSRQMERQCLSEEISVLSDELASFDIKFTELPKICPKQERARKQCILIAKAIIENERMKNNLLNHHRISQNEISKEFGIHIKTIEKHRKYIVTIAILLMGDYPSIQTFIPQYKEVR